MSEEDLVNEMLQVATYPLPDIWWKARTAMQNDHTKSYSGHSLQSWLKDIYFDYRLEQGLAREDIVALGEIVSRMLRFELGTRASTREMLEDPLLSKEVWHSMHG